MRLHRVRARFRRTDQGMMRIEEIEDGDHLAISAGWPHDGGEDDFPFVASIVTRTPRAEPTRAQPPIFPLADGLLRAGIERVFADGWVVRPRRPCPPLEDGADTPEEAARALGAFARTLSEVRYPMTTFWLVRRRDTGAAWAVVESNADADDRERFRDALRAGAVWLSIGDIMIDVIAHGSLAEEVMRWLRDAAEASAAPVRWELWDPD